MVDAHSDAGATGAGNFTKASESQTKEKKERTEKNMSSLNSVQCFIGLGSNLEQPLQQLNKARQKIAALSAITLCNSSSIYQSAALTLDGEPQNDYLNAVLEIQTKLKPDKLLDELQQLENQQGRLREKRWGARTLDLDILLYGNQQINTSRLNVPHAEIQNRNFVLIPLLEIAPDVVISEKFTVQKLIEKNSDQVLHKVKEFNGKA